MKSQVSIGGGGGGGGGVGRERRREKRKRICRAGKSRGSIVVINQKVPVVKMIPLIFRLPRGGGRGTMVTRPLPHGL